MRTETKLLFLALLAGGCSADVQTISGRVSPTGFPAPVTSVIVAQHGKVLTESPLDANGRFTLTLETGRQYKVFLVAGDRPTAQLIFPRAVDHSIDRTFDVHATSSLIDVGVVEYVGDPTTISFAFDCVDGMAPGGAICVDDEADGANSQEGTDELDGDNNQCGINEPDADNNDGGTAEADGDNVSDLDADTAIGDNNVPEDVGCDFDDGPGTDDGPGDDEPGTDDPGTPPSEEPGEPIL